MRTTTKALCAALSLGTFASPALANPINEPLAYSQRGIVLAPRDGRINAFFIYENLSASKSSGSYTEAMSADTSALSFTATWSPLLNWEIGIRPVTVFTSGGSGTAILNSIWTRYRFIQGQFELGGEFNYNTHVSLALPMRYAFSPEASLRITPKLDIAVDEYDYNYLTLDAQLAYNFNPAFYGFVDVGARVSLEDSGSYLGGGLGLGYSFNRGADAFIDLELSANFKSVNHEILDEDESVTLTTVQAMARFHF